MYFSVSNYYILRCIYEKHNYVNFLTSTIAFTSCDSGSLTGFIDLPDKEYNDKEDDREKDVEEIEVSELPQEIIDFIDSEYVGVEIVKAELNRGLCIIYLDNNTKLFFDMDGNLKWISTY